MWRERFIIHFNVADFAVAVERECDIGLRRRPVIIAPLGAGRAVVYDMSEEAFQSGVRKGMQLFQAQRRCPDAVVLPPRVEIYQRAMHDCLRRVKRFSPLVEHGAADGHFFLDVTGTHRLFGPPPDIGWKVRKEFSRDLGIAPIWTLSPNKLVAKVASRLVKPVGEYIVGAGEEEAFLAPLPVSLLPGVQTREMRRLQELSIKKVGQLARFSREQLMVPFGNRSDFFYRSSRGIDHREVVSGIRQSAVFSCDHHFEDDTNDQRQVRRVIAELAARAGAKLRRRGQEARRIGLKIGYSDGVTVVRQVSRRLGSSSNVVLRDLALLALNRAWRRRTRLRSCQLSCAGLHRRSPQLSLPNFDPALARSQSAVTKAMNTICHRFGENAIQLGCR